MSWNAPAWMIPAWMRQGQVSPGHAAEAPTGGVRASGVWVAEVWTADGAQRLDTLRGERCRAHASADEARRACARYRDEALYWTAEDDGGWWAAGDEAGYRVAPRSPLIHLLTTPL